MIYAFNNLKTDAQCIVVFQDISWPLPDLEHAREIAKDVGAFGIWRRKQPPSLPSGE